MVRPQAVVLVVMVPRDGYGAGDWNEGGNNNNNGDNGGNGNQEGGGEADINVDSSMLLS